MKTLQQALNSINFNESSAGVGEYGLHDGFFNALVVINNISHHVQGCCNNESFDPRDCGHDDGICGDVNYPLAAKLSEDLGDGFKLIEIILEKAYEIYLCKSK